MLKLDCTGIDILIIPDQHFPYHHPDTFAFLEAIKKKYFSNGPFVTINLGDEIDHHNLSFHEKELGAPSASDELKDAKIFIKELEKIFPKQYVLESNHGSLLYRRAKHHGIPLEYFKTYKEVLETEKFSWHEDILTKTKMGMVYFCHGKSSAIGRIVKELGCSSVQGHFHTRASINWFETVMGSRFCMYAGCLVDRDRYAFRYARANIPRFIVNVSRISKYGYPHLIKMELDSNGRWTKNLP